MAELNTGIHFRDGLRPAYPARRVAGVFREDHVRSFVRSGIFSFQPTNLEQRRVGGFSSLKHLAFGSRFHQDVRRVVFFTKTAQAPGVLSMAVKPSRSVVAGVPGAS